MSSEIILDFSRINQKEVTPTDQQKEVLKRKGNALCKGCPGSGKSTIIELLAEKDLEGDRNPLIIVRTNVAKERLEYNLPNVKVTTLHSLCAKYVKYRGNFDELLEDFYEQDRRPYFDSLYIDELQDLGNFHLDIITSLLNFNPKAIFFGVFDPYQSIYIGDWAGGIKGSALGEEIEEGIRSRIKIEEETVLLTENFRSNQHIVDQLEGIFKRGLTAKGPKDIGKNAIFSRWNAELKNVSNLLAENGISHKLREKKNDAINTRYIGENPKWDLRVLHAMKGEQFDKGLIFDWNEDPRNFKEDLYLLYTSIARFAKEVYIIGNDKLYKPMGEFWSPSVVYPYQDWLNLVV